jgi:hypothetical protein
MLRSGSLSAPPYIRGDAQPLNPSLPFASPSPLARLPLPPSNPSLAAIASVVHRSPRLLCLSLPRSGAPFLLLPLCSLDLAPRRLGGPPRLRLRLAVPRRIRCRQPFSSLSCCRWQGLKKGKAGKAEWWQRKPAVPDLVASSASLLAIRSAPPSLFCFFRPSSPSSSPISLSLSESVWFAQAISGEVVDGNSGAPTKVSPVSPLLAFLFSFSFCFLIQHLLDLFSAYCFTYFLRRPLRDQRLAMAEGDDPTSHNYELRAMGLHGDD